MLTRNGEEIEIAVECDGRQKKLGEGEMGVVIDTRAHFGRLVASSAARLEVHCLALLASAAAKSLMKKDYLAEKKALFEARVGFRAKRIIVAFRGKRLEFDVEDALMMQALYSVGSIFVKNSYMMEERFAKGGSVVDAGANLGFFSFLAYCYGAQKIYAFEPVKATYSILENYIRQNKLEGIVTCVNKALGSEDGEAMIRYDSRGDLTAALSGAEGKAMAETVQVVKLDSFLGSEAVAFIKMDTEGYEAEIIQGAKGAIARFKPAMCLSAYHKKGDRESLPALIKGMRADYSMKLVDFGEENLFCE